MNIDTASKINSTTSTSRSNTQNSSQKEGEVNFKDELKSLSSSKEEKQVEEKDSKQVKNTNDDETKNNNTNSDDDINEVIDGLQNIVKEVNDAKTDEKLGQKDDKIGFEIKPKDNNTDNNDMINNDLNIQEPKEPIMPQMNSGMNFNSDGQPFTAFVQQNQNQLANNQDDLKEESEILSTMAENIAMINKNNLLNSQNEKAKPEVKTVSNSEGIKKVDSKTNVTVDTIVSYDTVTMNENDVDFFANLVQNGEVDMNSIKNAEKSSQVSKTLADLLAKSMEDNKPVRIDFDNNISVIIKISRNGKISADFLPSSQIAEAYLKENLPLLRQKFDDNNIDYEQLNQRKQQQDGKNRRKKGRDDE